MEAYISDNNYDALVDALMRVERDPDAIMLTLSEVGGVFPESIWRDQLATARRERALLSGTQRQAR